MSWAHSFSRLLNLSAQNSAVAQIWALKYSRLLNLCIKLLIMRLNPYSKVVRPLSVCVCVCVRLNNSGTTGPIWLNFFLLAPSWSQGGFRPKKFRIRDPVFPEIRKNPDFRVSFDQFGWHFQVILTLAQICFNTNKFLDRLSGSPNPESGFSGKIR